MVDKNYRGCPFDELDTLIPGIPEQQENKKIRIYKQDIADQLGVDVEDLEIVDQACRA